MGAKKEKVLGLPFYKITYSFEEKKLEKSPSFLNEKALKISICI